MASRAIDVLTGFSCAYLPIFVPELRGISA
jgi:hypothetical protein